MKSFTQQTELDEELNKKVKLDEATAGDFLMGLGAVGGLLALKKGWDTFGKGTKLQKKLHALNPFQTQKDKAAVAKDIEDKRKGDVEDAKTILDDPDASEKDKAKAQGTLDKKQTGDEKATAKVDADKAKKDKGATAADAAMIGKKRDSEGNLAKQKDAQQSKDISGTAPPGWATSQGKPGSPKEGDVWKTSDHNKWMEKRKADTATKLAARKAKKSKPASGDSSGAGQGTTTGQDTSAADRLLQRTDFMHLAKNELSEFEEKDRNEILKNLVLEETMTITESNELQAIMALDDAGISAEINRKGEVSVKKKDLKKAQKIIAKEFKKGGEPKLVGEEVVVLQPDELVDLSTYIEMKMSNAAKKKKALWAKSAGGKKSLLKSKKRALKVKSGSIKINKARGRAMAKARKKGGIRNEFELGEGLVTEALGKLDKSVIDAFYYKKEKAGKVVSSDGDTLYKDGMGGQTIAQWLNPSGKIAISAVTDVKSTESILKYMKKSIPKGNFDKKSYKKFFGEELQRTAYELVSEARKKSIANKPQWEQE